MLNTYTLPWLFVESVQKRNGYLSASISKSETISVTWVIVLFHLNTFLLPFVSILSWKYIHHVYFLVFYALNTPRKPYFFYYNREKRNIYFSCRPLAFETSFPLFFFTSKPVNMLRSTLFLVCFFVNTLFIFFFFAAKLVIASAASVLLHFNLEKHHSYFAFSCLITVYLFYCLLRGF